MISKYNHRHADHTVYTSEFGHVTTQGTGVASIVEAVKFVEDKA